MLIWPILKHDYIESKYNMNKKRKEKEIVKHSLENMKHCWWKIAEIKVTYSRYYTKIPNIQNYEN